MSFDGLTRRSWVTGAAVVAAEMGTASRAEAGPEPLAWTIQEPSAALGRGAISSEELTKLCLARVGKLDKVLNAFVTVDGDSALTQARECDRQRRAGHVRSRLHGVPLALKDNIDTEGLKTTAAARVLRIVFLPKMRK
jgi:aspartyl-tRNA(Asn)/glutamyl-tRNA(Gln) amidotransferase subunit A